MTKQNKDEQIRELRYSKRVITIWCTIFGLLLLSFMILDTFVFNYGDLKQELQTCQDKVPVQEWIIKMVCHKDKIEFGNNSLEMNITSIIRFSGDYAFYTEFLKNLKKSVRKENCEVIE